MPAVVLRLRVEVRQRWLPWLGVALVAGIASGGILGLLAGAVRTRDAYQDFSRTMRAADAIVAGRSPFGLGGAADLDDVERLPQVRDTARAGVSLVFTGRSDDGRRVGPVDLFPVLPADDRLGTVIERMDIREGRAADPRAVDEATASFVLAERLGLHPGSTIRLRFLRPSSFPTAAATLLSNFGARLAGAPGSSSSAIDELADGPDVTFRIVGIEASPSEFPPVGPELAPPLHLTRAFTDRYGSHVVSSPLLFVRLRDPGQLDAFSKGIERLANGQPAGFVQSRPLQTPKVERAIRVQATAVRLVALLALVAVLLVVGQALLRQAFAEAGDDRVLRALGLERNELRMLVLARGLVIGVISAVLAVVVAVLMSPLMPVGLARVADLHQGFDVDPLLLGLGALAVLVGVVALASPGRVAGARGRVGDRVGAPPVVREPPARAEPALPQRRHRGALRARPRARRDVVGRSGRPSSGPRSPSRCWPACGRSRSASSTCSTRSGSTAGTGASRAARRRCPTSPPRWCRRSRTIPSSRPSRPGRSRRPSSGSSGST